ncbi:hypothetical protein SCATT_33290 [Streptantibioticus cattleyicolor NRRL 8057 = DSM 46488]|uniref:SMODS and SLOG-associating 2TM effector domain-containing protein n=1 Tax=Streptantibioticus cattleyicolor (strain ATCC 35852 / DSM 46488 / JCM 4925 / NBRC 14057 / NRRL 8057) TaxID=1003195 RepID=G8WQU1_STREN|nr:hypothetical protein SCATT_33290 [Streptantibioticus cattleyicolor NRRL 8057 = DSM 46488]
MPAWFGRPVPGRAGGLYRRGRPPRPHRERREDLRTAPFPVGDWGDPAVRLDELYRWAEGTAVRTADWYLADRVWKRRWARVLRGGAVLGAAGGVALPALRLTDVPGALAGWGYLGLLAAVVCVGVDRWFGLSSGWMRDVATAQAVQRRLEALRFDWASESVREVLGPTEGTASEAAERCLAVLRRFCEDVSDLVRGETAEWLVEFGAGSGPLYTQSLTGWARRPEGSGPSRFPLPPGGRPSMPRQRPPEGPPR